MAEFNGKEGIWRTVGGRRIFIVDGEDLVTAMKKSGKFNIQNKKEELEKNIIDIVNNGQVFDFGVGPAMTVCSRYENGDYKYLYSSGDSPMSFFENEIVPYLKNEFVVVDDRTNKISRASRFKKYGYEVVGEINQRAKNISQGIFVNEEPEYVRDKWILMRKK